MLGHSVIGCSPVGSPSAGKAYTASGLLSAATQAVPANAAALVVLLTFPVIAGSIVSPQSAAAASTALGAIASAATAPVTARFAEQTFAAIAGEARAGQTVVVADAALGMTLGESAEWAPAVPTEGIITARFGLSGLGVIFSARGATFAAQASATSDSAPALVAAAATQTGHAFVTAEQLDHAEAWALAASVGVAGAETKAAALALTFGIDGNLAAEGGKLLSDSGALGVAAAVNAYGALTAPVVATLVLDANLDQASAMTGVGTAQASVVAGFADDTALEAVAAIQVGSVLATSWMPLRATITTVAFGSVVTVTADGHVGMPSSASFAVQSGVLAAGGLTAFGLSPYAATAEFDTGETISAVPDGSMMIESSILAASLKLLDADCLLGAVHRLAGVANRATSDSGTLGINQNITSLGIVSTFSAADWSFSGSVASIGCWSGSSVAGLESIPGYFSEGVSYSIASSLFTSLQYAGGYESAIGVGAISLVGVLDEAWEDDQAFVAVGVLSADGVWAAAGGINIGAASSIGFKGRLSGAVNSAFASPVIRVAITPDAAKAMYKQRLVGGEIITVRRYVGAGPARAKIDVAVHARIAGFDGKELIGAVQQGERTVILLADDLVAGGLTMPLTSNDKIVARGKEMSIVSADDSTRRCQGVLIAYELKVRG